MKLGKLLVGALWAIGCDAGLTRPAVDGDGGGDLAVAAAPDLAPACHGLRCALPACAPGTTTTISGVVNIPAGDLPLYNATVYVPNSEPDPVVHGASCDRCDDLITGDPISLDTTDVKGAFTLKDVPAGPNIPIIIRLGKWRRRAVIPNVAPCTSNSIDPDFTRLPRSQAEGDLPRIALVTGMSDATECLLRKIGIADSEFTPEGGAGRVNLFAGYMGTNSYQAPLNNGAAFTVASDTSGKADGWWSSLANLKRYDILVFSCEGQQYLDQKSPAARQALLDYLDMGGRVYATHWANVWIQNGPMPLASVATFYDQMTSEEWNTTIDTTIDTASPKGGALADWLVETGASMARGTLPLAYGRNTVMSNDPKLTQRVVFYTDPMRGGADDTEYFSFNTPVGAPPAQQCGRMVFTDMHVSGNNHNDKNLDMSAPTLPFPTGCVSKVLLPQEKALLFLLFDLTGCLQTSIQ